MHFGILASPLPGHLHPLASLGRALLLRGHRVTVFHFEDARAECERLGMAFHAIGADDFPAGAWARWWHPIAEADGAAARSRTIDARRAVAEMMCRDVPGAARALGVEALIVDAQQLHGAAISERLGVPFVTVDCTLAPGSASSWVARRARELLARPELAVANQWRRRWGLTEDRSTADTCSRLLHLSQLPSALERLGFAPSRPVRRCGPLLDGGRPEPEFPWEKLDGRPLVYASFGTLRNRQAHLYECVADAAEQTVTQWVLSFGAWQGEPIEVRRSPSVICVPYAPQLRLLSRASVCVTSAGMSTTLESLSAGVPLVAVPIGDEQPAIAARVVAAGAGLSIPAGRLTAARLAAAVRRVVEERSFGLAAQALQQELVLHGGARRAADEIERALRPARVPAFERGVNTDTEQPGWAAERQPRLATRMG